MKKIEGQTQKQFKITPRLLKQISQKMNLCLPSEGQCTEFKENTS